MATLLFSIIFGLIGGLSLLAAAFLWRRTRSFVRESVRADGEVVALEERVDDGSPAYAPVVRYTTPDGVSRQFVHHTASRPASYKVGQWVKIRYHWRRPEDARMAGGCSLYLTSLIFALVGAVFLFIALLVAPFAQLSGAD